MRPPTGTGLGTGGGGWTSQSSSGMSTDSDEEEVPRFRPEEHDPTDFYETTELKVPDGELDDGTGQVVCHLAQDWTRTTISKLHSVQGEERAP